MKWQSLFSGKIQKNILYFCLLNFLPSILNVKGHLRGMMREGSLGHMHRAVKAQQPIQTLMETRRLARKKCFLSSPQKRKKKKNMLWILIRSA